MGGTLWLLRSAVQPGPRAAAGLGELQISQNMSVDSDVMLQNPEADTGLLVISRLQIISNAV